MNWLQRIARSAVGVAFIAVGWLSFCVSVALLYFGFLALVWLWSKFMGG